MEGGYVTKDERNKKTVYKLTSLALHDLIIGLTLQRDLITDCFVAKRLQAEV
jgi:hypothetical protein